jgi:Fic family protein
MVSQRCFRTHGSFSYLCVRKEALLSSQIEGTKSSFSDLLLFENEAVPGVPIDDVEEVSNYVAAMQHGLRRIKGGFPLSLHLCLSSLFRHSERRNRAVEESLRSMNIYIDDSGTSPENAVAVQPW